MIAQAVHIHTAVTDDNIENVRDVIRKSQGWVFEK